MGCGRSKKSKDDVAGAGEAELDGFEPIDPAGPAEVALEVDDDSLTSDSDDGIVADPVRRQE